MVYISKVYTKSGDAGQTMLASGDRVSKAAQRIRSYGDVDELNAVIGMMRSELGRDPQRDRDPTFAHDLEETLGRIQQELFNLGAELSTPGAVEGEAKLCVQTRHVEQLEHDIDRWNASLSALRSFVLPGGGPTAAVCHLARTVCRRAERETVALAAEEPVRPEALVYLNRLSDLMFVVGRALAGRLGYDEVLWDPATT